MKLSFPICIAAMGLNTLIVVHGQPGCAGSLDLGFDIGKGVQPDRAAPTPIEAVAVQPDGKVIIVGNFESLPEGKQWGAARFYQDGSLDPDFEYDPQAITDHTSAAQPDGKILTGSMQ